MKGYQALGTLMRESGIRVVFSMIGGTNVPWLGHGVASGDFRLVKTRHETTAVAAACGYARAIGAPGVCTVTRGPGFANAINSIICAVRNHVPLLIVVGESPSPDSRTGQNVNQRGFTELIGAGFHHAAEAQDLPAAFHESLRAAAWNGIPQVLSIGDAVLDGSLSPGAMLDLGAADQRQSSPDPGEIASVVDVLQRSRHPLILAGQGAILAGCKAELERLAAVTGSLLSTTALANRMFTGSSYNLGICGGWAPAIIRDRLREVDAVVAFGASMNQFTMSHGQLFSNSVLVHVDIDPTTFGLFTSPDVTVVGDARLTASAIMEEWSRRGLPARPAPLATPTHTEIQESVMHVGLGGGTAYGIDPRVVYRMLDEKLPVNRVVTTDSGRSLPTLLSLVDAQDAQSFLLGRGYGSTGLGIGMAIGAAVARPSECTVLFSGDGGFMMAAQDLDAIRLAGLDVTIIVMNDQQYGAELGPLERFGLPSDIARQDTPDLVALAKVFGGDGAVVETESQLRELKLPRSGLFIVDARIDPGLDARRALGAEAEAWFASNTPRGASPAIQH